MPRTSDALRDTRRGAPPAQEPRKRRTAEGARTAILDAAERRLVASGPAAIRLQEVAADVGVSHPTVLHHFGSREALVEAVVRRALDSLHAQMLSTVRAQPGTTDQVASLLDAVFEALADGGHGRTFMWLALSGYAPAEDLRIRSLAEAVHTIRRERRRGKKRPASFEDTYFTVLLPALALLSLSVIGAEGGKKGDSDPLGPRRFRRWLARLIHEHLERD
jgi:AcrR family transcriptional regulator